MKLSVRRVSTLGLVGVLGSVAALPVSSAYAQGSHQGGHSTQVPADPQGLAVGVAHGTTLGAAVFLAGLVAFATLVWLPAYGTEDDVQEKAVNLFCRCMWVLVCLLAVAGLVEIPLYAVRASGEDLSLGLLGEALFDTRVGQLWIARLALAILTAATATYAARRLRQRPAYWSISIVVGAIMLTTLTQQSHAAAEGRLLPFVSDWAHVVAASAWMGGLLGFPILLIGPLRAMTSETRAKLLERTVRRFSKVATIAVVTLIATGIYAILLHVPSLSALLDTSYGRALIVKLGLFVLLLAAGGLNLIARGQGPFDRVIGAELILALGVFVATGFLTSSPPADAELLERNQATSAENVSQIAPTLREAPMPYAP
jgi:copper transport protein